MSRLTVEERFWKYLPNKPEASDPYNLDYSKKGCWEWVGATVRGGYGSLKINNKKIGAHRFSWELHNGPIPEGLMTLHKCDNPPCCRPDHLFIGTGSDNMQDRAAKGRDNAVATGAVLTELEVQEVLIELNMGRSQAEIAEMYGVTQTTISRILHGETWRELTGTLDSE